VQSVRDSVAAWGCHPQRSHTAGHKHKSKRKLAAAKKKAAEKAAAAANAEPAALKGPVDPTPSAPAASGDAPSAAAATAD
jgi:D-alanyl-D-alanine carboxypeptidase